MHPDIPLHSLGAAYAAFKDMLKEERTIHAGKTTYKACASKCASPLTGYSTPTPP